MNKKVMVIGASVNKERYSYLAIIKLRQKGHNVVAVGSKAGVVDDVTITTEKAFQPDVDTITLYIGADKQPAYYDYILALRPKRIIFNPGAENPELFAIARKAGIEAIEACTLVMLSTGQF